MDSQIIPKITGIINKKKENHSFTHAAYKSMQLYVTMCLASESCLYKTHPLWQLARQHMPVLAVLQLCVTISA